MIYVLNKQNNVGSPKTLFQIHKPLHIFQNYKIVTCKLERHLSSFSHSKVGKWEKVLYKIRTMQIFYVFVLLVCPIVCACLLALWWTMVGNSVCSKQLFVNLLPKCVGSCCSEGTSEGQTNIETISQREETILVDKPPSYSSLFLLPKYEDYKRINVFTTSV